MLQTFQQQTKSGKAIINRTTKLPEFTRDINQRMKVICKELGIPTKFIKGKLIPQYNDDQRMSLIRNTNFVKPLFN